MPTDDLPPHFLTAPLAPGDASPMPVWLWRLYGVLAAGLLLGGVGLLAQACGVWTGF